MIIQPGFRRALSVLTLAGTVALLSIIGHSVPSTAERSNSDRKPQAGKSASEGDAVRKSFEQRQFVSGQDIWWRNSGSGRLAAAGRALTFANLEVKHVMAAAERVLLNDMTVTSGIFAMGYEVTASKTSVDRLFAFGNRLAITNTTAREILAIGQDMILNGVDIRGDIVLSGGDVVMDPASAIAGNAWMSGKDLGLSGSVIGDLTASGTRLRIDGRVGHDALLSADRVDVGPGSAVGGKLVADGGILTITDVTAGDIIASGHQVILESVTVKDDALLTGDRVKIDARSHVTGNAIVIADELDVAGTIDGDVTLSGRIVRIDGRITGDVDLTAERLEIGAGARIEGALLHRAQSIDIASEAVISGPVSAFGAHHGVAQGSLLFTLIGLGMLAVVLLLPAAIVLSLILAWLMPGLMTGGEDSPLGGTFRLPGAAAGRVAGETLAALPGRRPDLA